MSTLLPVLLILLSAAAVNASDLGPCWPHLDPSIFHPRVMPSLMPPDSPLPPRFVPDGPFQSLDVSLTWTSDPGALSFPQQRFGNAAITSTCWVRTGNTLVIRGYYQVDFCTGKMGTSFVAWSAQGLVWHDPQTSTDRLHMTDGTGTWEYNAWVAGPDPDDGVHVPIIAGEAAYTSAVPQWYRGADVGWSFPFGTGPAWQPSRDATPSCPP
jgi:hypothetical protein